MPEEDLLCDIAQFINKRHCNRCVATRKKKHRIICRPHCEAGKLLNRIEEALEEKDAGNKT